MRLNFGSTGPEKVKATSLGAARNMLPGAGVTRACQQRKNAECE